MDIWPQRLGPRPWSNFFAFLTSSPQLRAKSDRDSRLVSWLVKSTWAIGTNQCSTCFHARTDHQSERTIQTFEDVLRGYVMDFDRKWDNHCLQLNLNTRVTNLAFKWYHSRIYTEGNGITCFSWWSRGTTATWTRSGKKTTDKIKMICDCTLVAQKHQSVTSINDEQVMNLKWVIMYLLEYHDRKVSWDLGRRVY